MEYRTLALFPPFPRSVENSTTSQTQILLMTSVAFSFFSVIIINPDFILGNQADASLQSKFLGFILVTAAMAYLVAPYILRHDLKDRDGHSIPPGPPFRYPFLPKYCERILHRWTKKYGGIYSVWMGNQLFVVLNDPVVVRDLLVVNGANFSSRWNFFMKNQTILKGGGITATPYNDMWYVIGRPCP